MRLEHILPRLLHPVFHINGRIPAPYLAIIYVLPSRPFPASSFSLRFPAIPYDIQSGKGFRFLGVRAACDFNGRGCIMLRVFAKAQRSREIDVNFEYS